MVAWSASLVRTRYLPVRKLGILDGLTLLVRISDDVNVKNVIFNLIPALRTKVGRSSEWGDKIDDREVDETESELPGHNLGI